MCIRDRFTHSIIVVVTISLWKTSLKCEGKLEEIVIAYHLKFHITATLKSYHHALRDMTESRHMLQEHKLRWGWKVCCNQNTSSSSFSDLKLSLIALHKRPEKSIVFSSLVLSFALGWDLVDKSFVSFEHSWDPLIHSTNIFTRLFQII